MPLSFFVAEFLTGLAYAMLLFLMAVGLTVIFGLMDVLNLAHGTLFMLGAYIGLSVVLATHSFWLAAAAAPVAVGLLAVPLEAMLRPLYRRGYLDQVLLTFGVALAASDGVRAIWGSNIHTIAPPPGLGGSAEILGGVLPQYDLFVAAVGLVLAVVVWLVMSRSRLGAVIRAGVTDRAMVSALGINVGRAFRWVFVLGAALAGLSGVVAGPILGAYPGIDLTVLLLALIVVVVGGLGTISGAFWGSMLVGEVVTFGQALLPQAALFITFAVMAAILLWRPTGLLGSGS